MSDDFDSMTRHPDDRCHQSAIDSGYGDDIDQYETYCDGFDVGVATVSLQLAELKANNADAMNALMDEVHESKKNAAFFRCCALSGEVPKDGAEPHPKKEYEPPSKELLAALLQEKGE